MKINCFYKLCEGIGLFIFGVGGFFGNWVLIFGIWVVFIGLFVDCVLGDVMLFFGMLFELIVKDVNNFVFGFKLFIILY